MKKLRMISAGFLALFLAIEAFPLQQVQAAAVRAQETGELYDEAVLRMEEESYAAGEALVSFEASEGAALATEGTYRYDSKVTIQRVCAFGTDEDSGKTRYIVHLVSDSYTTQQLLQLSLKQYYVDAVSANSSHELASVDPYKNYQWYLDGSDTSSKGVRWSKKRSLKESDTPVIAVLDSGVDYTHPDLADNMWVNPYPKLLKGTYGYDFGDNDADPMDTNGHGTHVAGIAAAAQNNGIGITGASDAQIMAVKIEADGSDNILDDAIIAGFEYVLEAMEAGVNVCAVNCSWGGSSDPGGLFTLAIDAIGEMGALTVFASGNDGIDRDQAGASCSPYDIDSPYVVIVGASSEDDEAAEYADYGKNSVDLYAPGSNILSAWTEDTFLPAIYSDSKRKKLTSYFNRCGADDTNILPADQTWSDLYTAEEMGLNSVYDVEMEREKDGTNRYLSVTVTRLSGANGDESVGSVYVDVTDLQLDETATYYVSMLEGESSGSSITWETVMCTSTPEDSRFVTVGDRTYMRIRGMIINRNMVGTTYQFYLDDIAISKADADTEQFGKYFMTSGTSMAAPLVSAAVATLASANPSLNARTIRKNLMKCVRVVDDLSDKCITGGIIDFSKLRSYATKVTLNRKSASVAAGTTLRLKAKVSPTYVTSKGVKWKSSNTAWATVNANGLVRVKRAGIGHTVRITAKTTDGSKKSAVCKIKIKS